MLLIKTVSYERDTPVGLAQTQPQRGCTHGLLTASTGITWHQATLDPSVPQSIAISLSLSFSLPPSLTHTHSHSHSHSHSLSHILFFSLSLSLIWKLNRSSRSGQSQSSAPPSRPGQGLGVTQNEAHAPLQAPSVGPCAWQQRTTCGAGCALNVE